jgi:hypothetical protein
MADRAVDMLTEAILERDQPRTTDLFHRMVAREGRSIGEALGAVTTAEAPFVQVPSHINVRDGQITLINNDLADAMRGVRAFGMRGHVGHDRFAQLAGLDVEKSVEVEAISEGGAAESSPPATAEPRIDPERAVATPAPDETKTEVFQAAAVHPVATAPESNAQPAVPLESSDKEERNGEQEAWGGFWRRTDD